MNMYKIYLFIFMASVVFSSGCDPETVNPDNNNTNTNNNTSTNSVTNNATNNINTNNNDAGADAENDVIEDIIENDALPDGDITENPSVEILSPSDGSSVENPVIFTIGYNDVATVQILADDWPLSDPWDPAVNTSLTYTFSGTGYARNIVLQGFDSNGSVVASDSIVITIDDSDPGTFFGNMYNTFYYLAMESDYPSGSDATLYDSSCNPIVNVSSDFSDDICIEGSGKLSDGRILNYATSCSCGRSCPTGGIVCYQILDSVNFPWGMGSSQNALIPLHSWAVDSDLIQSGTVLYAEGWDGITIPEIDGVGGYVHDGCFRADDVGGWINGMHYDFFAATHDMWIWLEGVMPTNTYTGVYTGTSKCQYLAE
ncbi:MAG: hypothetical protein JXR95_03770 [Deltaproteobacteria bacterium]|nr:hypothetical protein [Deltaproteobacteria bacterium]